MATTRQNKRQQKLSNYFTPSAMIEPKVAIKLEKRTTNTRRKKQGKLTILQQPIAIDDFKDKESAVRDKTEKYTSNDTENEDAQSDTAFEESTASNKGNEEKLAHHRKKRYINFHDTKDEGAETDIHNKSEEANIIENKKKDVEGESEEDETVTNKHLSRKKKRRVIQDSDDDDDAEEEDRHAGKEVMEAETTIIADQEAKDGSEAEDIQEDLDFLDKTDILDQRTRGRQTSRYSQALKKLKDRKSKLSQYDYVEKGPLESYIKKVDDINDSKVDDEDIDDTFVCTDDEDTYEEEFVVDDDVIDGVKTADKSEAMELPPEFSKHRNQSFSRHLETYIEYLIELVLNPVFTIADKPRFEMAKTVVLRRVQGYKDSMVTSDAWLPPFKEAVDKNVNWKQTSYINLDFEGFGLACEACRSNKPASIEITLSNNDSYDDPTVLYLGSECCRKGEMYHHFYHFEEHMYKKVKDLVTMARRHTKKNAVEPIYDYLTGAGDVKRLTRSVKKSFNEVVMIYNLRGHRSRVEEASSSDED